MPFEDVQIKQKKGRSRLTFVCERDITITANDRLLEQAIVNLIDNAINYSDPGSKSPWSCCKIVVGPQFRSKIMALASQKEHIPRLFERFYRVDRGRSRKQGGTGLGLAIVKHIVNAHNGHMTVESIPGSEVLSQSTFPKNQLLKVQILKLVNPLTQS